jgi:hypothetical protein
MTQYLPSASHFDASIARIRAVVAATDEAAEALGAMARQVLAATDPLARARQEAAAAAARVEAEYAAHGLADASGGLRRAIRHAATGTEHSHATWCLAAGILADDAGPGDPWPHDLITTTLPALAVLAGSAAAWPPFAAEGLRAAQPYWADRSIATAYTRWAAQRATKEGSR